MPRSGAFLGRAAWPRPACALLLAVPIVGCGGGEGREAFSTDGMPLHLEEHLDAAEVEAEIAGGDLEPLRWSFDAPDPAWQPLTDADGRISEVSWTGGVLTLVLGRYGPEGADFHGGATVAVPDLDHAAWGEVLVRARTPNAEWINPGFNLGERYVEAWDETLPFRYLGTGARLIQDGGDHLYRLPIGPMLPAIPEWEEGEPWRELVLSVWAPNEATIEILSVEVVPRMARYAGAAAGVDAEQRGRSTRRTLFTHTPAKVRYRIEMPPGARLDFGMAVLQSAKPVTFRVGVSEARGEERTPFEEVVTAVGWQQRTVDLSRYAGETVDLTLVAEGEPGGIALWAAPTLSGERSEERRAQGPNVVFYVIDGAGADLMSVYGYNRRTTPNLQRLAAEGVVFEMAYSNSAWTKPSTASFMTSLHQSALGGFRSLQDQVPAAATTMAEHFHRAGYQTAVFASNPWAGSLSGLERGVDRFRDHDEEDHHSTSSARLHDEYWEWRDDYPGGPYWVHFQSTDVHEPHEPVAPFAGLWVHAERRAWFHETWERLNEGGAGRELWQKAQEPQHTLAELYRARLEELEVDPRQFFETQRGLYDETMAHQDHQLGRFVARLQAAGEWEDTLLVVASDHGHPAGSFSRFGRELFDPLPASDEGALLDAYRTRIPMLFVWPGRLPAGRRIAEPVSMIDMLPTLLELADLPPPEVLQGQSLVPLLRDEPGWERRPVILEQLQPVPDQGALVGHIEMVDGRWGASLEIWPESLDPAVARPDGNQRAARPHRPGMPRLYLYDLWQDPFARQRVNDRHPELVEKYTRLLEEQWRHHQALAQRFEPGGEVEMSAEQLESLRALGYIQ